jgi:hypothetical protein
MGELLIDAGIADTPKNNEMIAKSILNAAKVVTPENTLNMFNSKQELLI